MTDPNTMLAVLVGLPSGAAALFLGYGLLRYAATYGLKP